MAVDPEGSLYIATQPGGSKIVKIRPDGSRVVLAGTDETGFSGDGGPATSAKFAVPLGVARDDAGNLFVADTQNHRIRKIGTSGLVSTIAGDGNPAEPQFGVSTTLEPLKASFRWPWQIRVDRKGNIYFLNSGRFGRYLMSISAVDGLLHLILPLLPYGRTIDPFEPFAFTLDSEDNIIVAGTDDGERTFKVMRVRADGAKEVIESATGFIGAVYAADMDRLGNLYLAEANRLRRLAPDGVLSTIAGRAAGRWVPRTSVGSVARLAVHGSTLFFADTVDGSVRKIMLDQCKTDPQPLIAANGLVDSATYGSSPSTQQGNFSSGQLITIFGKGLASAAGASGEVQNGTLGTRIGETRVLFEGSATPLLYASDTQINAVLPFKLGWGCVQAEVRGVTSDRQCFAVIAPVTPALFIVPGTLPPQQRMIAVHLDGTLNSMENPAAPDSIVLIWGSGFGSYATELADGEVAQAAVPLTRTVTAQMNGQPLVVHYAGTAPGTVAGVVQLNIQLPAMAPSNVRLAEITFRVGETTTTGKLWVR